MHRSAKRIAVFFSTFFYLFQHLTSFSVIKCILQKIVTIQFYSFYFFAQNCEICFIRGPPVLFERKKSNRTEENTLDNNDDYSYRIESKNGTEMDYSPVYYSLLHKLFGGLFLQGSSETDFDL